MPSFPFYRILLLDDDPTVNFLNRLLIEEMALGEQVDIFTDGASALRFLSGLEATHWPDLILVDVNMAGMDGFEFLDRYYALHGIQKGQVVMLSSSSYPRDVVRANQYGIAGYLTKPLSEAGLAGLMGLRRE